MEFQPRLDRLLLLLRSLDDAQTVRDAADAFWTRIVRVGGHEDLRRCVQSCVDGLVAGRIRRRRVNASRAHNDYGTRVVGRHGYMPRECLLCLGRHSLHHRAMWGPLFRPESV